MADSTCRRSGLPDVPVLQHPAPGTYSLAGYGPRRPIETPSGLSSSFHKGRDYSLHGRTFPVLAAAAGTVRWAYRSEFGGLEVLIEHQLPGYLATRYGHLSRFEPGIVAGARVAAGQQLGMSGKTGRADGVHLHFEVFTDRRLGDRQVDPDPYLFDNLGDDMALTPTQAAGLDWLGKNIEELDLARWQTGDLHARRGILDQLALQAAQVYTDDDPGAIAAAVVARLGGDVAERLAGAILDAVRELPAGRAAG